MLQGVNSINTPTPVQTKELLQQADALWAHVRTESLLDVTLCGVPLIATFATWQLRPARHALLVWRTNQLEDAHALVNVGLALQDRLLLKHLGEDAANAPHVDGGCVLLEGE